MERNGYNPIDDAMFSKMAEDKAFCQEIIRVILGDPLLEVVECHAQEFLSNLKGRSVQLDALCRAGDGRRINVEVQKYADEEHQKRVRYHGALITANETPKNTRFSDVVDVCVIYIARFDIFGAGKSVYHVKRVVAETGESEYNGFEEIYVNAEVRDGSDISELMAVFTEDAAYSEKFPVTSDLKKRYREVDARMIYTYTEQLLDEGRAEGARQTLVNLVSKGILGIKDASEEAGMSEEDFRKLLEAPAGTPAK